MSIFLNGKVVCERSRTALNAVKNNVRFMTGKTRFGTLFAESYYTHNPQI